ncbi:osmoprotectant transport system substrate-binding protein [Brevibacterium sanguinis]|uniref:Osmoprotectant transport system substrate-binding protein n=2 Tax=Brevibacterium TaxID=1696 RepID=A0A366ILH4_9MICO|nr:MULTISPECIES: glycine betaine ABC transporter substrate-binding protein [Brevibacterium]RBP66090.1 osmoprotectant transport system substrate-binding protein [Brevibacterium sanguinis]RBP72741.1 osmoprotectant transport system substrate-binding protein [Brevibacterium celere]
MRTITRRTALSALAALGTGAAATAMAGCTPPSAATVGERKKDVRTITIGSKGFAESWIMGELYAQGLRALGYQIDLKTNVGSSDIISAALTSGQIDIYPEYTGVILVSFMGEESLMDSAEATYDLAGRWAEENSIRMLNATPFENKNAIAVRKEFADEHDLARISDLQGIGDFLYSTYPDNVTGAQGYEGIVEAYGLDNMELKTLSIGLNYQAIERGEIQAADVFTTDPQLLRSDLVVLDDDKKLFGFQNVVPLIRDDAYSAMDEDGPEFLNTLHSLLTLEAIQALNEASAINRIDAAQVAKVFLNDNGLM